MRSLRKVSKTAGYIGVLEDAGELSATPGEYFRKLSDENLMSLSLSSPEALA